MTPESALLRQITDYLTLKGIWWMRIQPFNGQTKSGRWMRSGKKGCADLLCTPLEFNGNWRVPAVVWLELKTVRGRQSADQIDFQHTVAQQGHYYRVIRDFTELEVWLKERSMEGK